MKIGRALRGSDEDRKLEEFNKIDKGEAGKHMEKRMGTVSSVKISVDSNSNSLPMIVFKLLSDSLISIPNQPTHATHSSFTFRFILTCRSVTTLIVACSRSLIYCLRQSVDCCAARLGVSIICFRMRMLAHILMRVWLRPQSSESS